MRDDSAPGQVHQIDRLCLAIGLRRLSTPLPRRNNWHDRIAAQHRFQARFDGSHDRFITLAELVPQAVDMNMIDARQAPKFLVCFEFHPKRRMPIEHPEAVSMSVNWQSGPPPQK